MPLGSVVVVIVGGTEVELIVIANAFVLNPILFSALTVKLNVPAVVGVPEISPLAEMVKPLGRLPLSILHVMGVLPVADSV